MVAMIFTKSLTFIHKTFNGTNCGITFQLLHKIILKNELFLSKRSIFWNCYLQAKSLGYWKITTITITYHNSADKYVTQTHIAQN